MGDVSIADKEGVDHRLEEKMGVVGLFEAEEGLLEGLLDEAEGSLRVNVISSGSAEPAACDIVLESDNSCPSCGTGRVLELSLEPGRRPDIQLLRRLGLFAVSIMARRTNNPVVVEV